jgi:hypothetical protein
MDGSEHNDWITERLNNILGNDNDPPYEAHPTTPRSLEDWASWVSRAICRETGLQLSEKQELIILRAFFFAFRQRGFDMCYCADEKPAASST